MFVILYKRSGRGIARSLLKESLQCLRFSNFYPPADQRHNEEGIRTDPGIAAAAGGASAARETGLLVTGWFKPVVSVITYFALLPLSRKIATTF